MSELRRAVVLSMVAHLILVSLFLMPLAFPGCGRQPGGSDQTQNPEPSQAPIDVEIVPLPEALPDPQPETTPMPEVTSIPEPEATESPEPEPSESPSPSPSEEPSPEPSPDCEDFFGGIGVTHDFEGVILDVYEGYPAYKHGLERGDRIVNHKEIRGKVGTEVYVVIDRAHEMKIIKMKRGKICLGKKPKKDKDTNQ